MGTPVERFADIGVRSHVRGRDAIAIAPRESITTSASCARAFLNLHFNFALREDRWDELLSVLIFGVRTELPLIWTNARTWRQLSENVVINLFSTLAMSWDDVRLSSLSETIFIKVTDVAAQLRMYIRTYLRTELTIELNMQCLKKKLTIFYVDERPSIVICLILFLVLLLIYFWY